VERKMMTARWMDVQKKEERMMRLKTSGSSGGDYLQESQRKAEVMKQKSLHAMQFSAKKQVPTFGHRNKWWCCCCCCCCCCRCAAVPLPPLLLHPADVAPLPLLPLTATTLQAIHAHLLIVY
jgi:hypothetical protein